MMQGSLAERLRVLRARQGLSLTEASKRAGITRDTLSDLERSKRQAYMPTLAKIADGYGVPVEDLLEEPALAGKDEAPQEAGQLDLEKATALREWLSNVRKTAQPIMEQDDQTIAAYRQALARMKGGIGVSDAYFVEEESPEQAKLEAEALDFLLAKEEQRRREIARSR
jgi:transcriptional regulator with XRE-family HTH domain